MDIWQLNDQVLTKIFEDLDGREIWNIWVTNRENKKAVESLLDIFRDSKIVRHREKYIDVYAAKVNIRDPQQIFLHALENKNWSIIRSFIFIGGKDSDSHYGIFWEDDIPIKFAQTAQFGDIEEYLGALDSIPKRRQMRAQRGLFFGAIQANRLDVAELVFSPSYVDARTSRQLLVIALTSKISVETLAFLLRNGFDASSVMRSSIRNKDQKHIEKLLSAGYRADNTEVTAATVSLDSSIIRPFLEYGYRPDEVTLSILGALPDSPKRSETIKLLSEYDVHFDDEVVLSY
jgi:hypothetical protein